jgi:SanA protein
MLKRFFRCFCWCCAAVVIAAAAALLGCDWLVSASTAGRVHDRLSDVPPAPTALLLGTSPKYAGRPNPFYSARIQAAAELFASGKVTGILVSGDNRRADYNEPEMMKADLVRAGVPGSCVTMDYAGIRTLDSVARAQWVFHQRKIIVVSQRYHAQRAVFLARHFGLEAEAYAAAEPGWNWMIRARIREVLARAMACMDIWILDRKPLFVGPVAPARYKPGTGQAG